jgi:hypothetical protein
MDEYCSCSVESLELQNGAERLFLSKLIPNKFGFLKNQSIFATYKIGKK